MDSNNPSSSPTPSAQTYAEELNERRILQAFGEPYFDGVRWGGFTSSLFFVFQVRKCYAWMRSRHIALDVRRGIDEENARIRATLLRTLRGSIKSDKLLLCAVLGGSVFAAHNMLAAALANLRVREFRSGRIPELRDPVHLGPDFEDGFVVGCFGSIMDADLPQQPPSAYRNFGLDF